MARSAVLVFLFGRWCALGRCPSAWVRRPFYGRRDVMRSNPSALLQILCKRNLHCEKETKIEGRLSIRSKVWNKSPGWKASCLVLVHLVPLLSDASLPSFSHAWMQTFSMSSTLPLGSRRHRPLRRHHAHGSQTPSFQQFYIRGCTP